MKTMSFGSIALAVIVGLLCWSCGSEMPESELGTQTQPTPMKSVVWLDVPDVGPGLADRLQRAGVDQIMLQIGSVEYSSGAPLLRLVRSGRIERTLPFGVVLRVESYGESVEAYQVQSMWQAVVKEFGAPVEIVIDDRVGSELTADLVTQLREIGGIDVSVLLTVRQLEMEAAQSAAVAAGTVIVPVFGIEGTALPGVTQKSADRLSERLEPLADLGVRVRPAIALKPRTEPEIGEWGATLDVLCDGDVTEIARASALDRSFNFRQAIRWSGREWSVGSSVSVAWVDAARLNLYLSEISRLVVPDLAGWDVVSLPPPTAELGLTRDGLIEYLGGDGPAPIIEINAQRSGRNMDIYLVNRSPFTSAVSQYDNWIEVSVDDGVINVDDRGEFDRVILGTKRSGEWQPLNSTSIDAVRFEETYVDVREKIRAGRIRTPSARTDVAVEWQVILTTGDTVRGRTVFD